MRTIATIACPHLHNDTIVVAAYTYTAIRSLSMHSPPQRANRCHCTHTYTHTHLHSDTIAAAIKSLINHAGKYLHMHACMQVLCEHFATLQLHLPVGNIKCSTSTANIADITHFLFLPPPLFLPLPYFTARSPSSVPPRDIHFWAFGLHDRLLHNLGLPGCGPLGGPRRAHGIR